MSKTLVSVACFTNCYGLLPEQKLLGSTELKYYSNPTLVERDGMRKGTGNGERATGRIKKCFHII
ncbi:MAG: hypothetical protein AB4206_05940 [Xenococcaceae cyanobacterium]